MAEAWERQYEEALKRADSVMAHARDVGYVAVKSKRLGQIVIEYADFKYTFRKMDETDVLKQGTKPSVRGWLASAYLDSEKEQPIRLKAAVRDLTLARRQGETIVCGTRVGNVIVRYSNGTYSLIQYGRGKSTDLVTGKLAVVRDYLSTLYILIESPNNASDS